MEYNENKNTGYQNNKNNRKASLNLIVLIIILSLMLIITFIIFDNSFANSMKKTTKDNQIDKVHFSNLNIGDHDNFIFREEVQYIKLPNEVEIILINGTHNKKMKKNAIGVIVGSGAMNDDKIEGLAHFTEHMLFLGSKKYPNVTFFNEFVTTNDGHFNGFTDKDTTTFVYEINKQKFEESLDVFLNFFVRPLFKSEYLEKEIFAVNSEFEKNIHSEEKRFDRLFQSFANPLHPFSKFSTGNKDTIRPNHLKLHALRDHVIKYFHKHYVGRNIKVVVYGNYELNNIKKVLMNNLNKIHNHYQTSSKDSYLNKVQEKFGKELEIFTEQEKGKIIFYKSRYKSLKIFYILKDFKSDLGVNPKMFFKNLFSFRYKGALIEILRQKRLIFNFKIEFKDKYNNFNAIQFKFLLTEHGFKNVDLIIQLLSKYIQIFHKNIKDERLFNEIKKKINKRIPKDEFKSPYKNLKKWTKNFFLFGKDNFITADNMLNKYNPEVLHDVIKNMTLHNSLIFVGSRSFKHFNRTYLYSVLHNITEFGNNKNNTVYSENSFLNHKEKWYKTKYAEYKLDEDYIWHIFKRHIKNANLTYVDFNKNLTYDKMADNTLCKDKNDKLLKKNDCMKLFKSDRHTLAPNLIFNHTLANSSHIVTNVEIFHKLDRTHLKKSFELKLKIEPNVKNLGLTDYKTVPLIKFLLIYLNFQTSEIRLKFNANNYNNHVSINFLDNFNKQSNLFSWRNSKEKLRPQDYMIDGIYLNIKARSNGVFEKSDVYTILTELLEGKVNRRDFLYLKEELYREIEFYKSSNPSHQALNWLFRLGFKYDIDYFNMTHLIKHLTLEEINNFKEKVFSNFKIKSLAVGTISENIAKLFIKDLVYVIKDYSESASKRKEKEIDDSDKKLNKQISQQQFIQTPYTKYGSHFIFQKNNLYKHSPDSTTLNVYFLGANSIYNFVNMKIINNIAGNIFFSYLRIKHQLGYSIKHKLLNVDNNLMFSIHVQGSKKHPSHVHIYIDKVLLKIKAKLNKLDDSTFDRVKSLMFDRISNVPSKLNVKSDYYWGFILNQENIFNKKKLKEYIDRLTLYDLEKFIDKMLDKKLSIQVANTNTKYEKIDKESVYITDLDYFRKFAKYGTPNLNEKESEEMKFNPIVNMRLDLNKQFDGKHNQL